MNPHQITTPAPADDSRLISLCRDWLGLYRSAESIPNTAEGDKDFDAARERYDALATEVIAKVPAAGVAGIAIKAFLRLQIDPTGMDCLCPLERSILEDAARLVPEIEPLTLQGDVDAEPQVFGFGDLDKN